MEGDLRRVWWKPCKVPNQYKLLSKSADCISGRKRGSSTVLYFCVRSLLSVTIRPFDKMIPLNRTKQALNTMNMSP